MENPVLNQAQESKEAAQCVVGIIFHRDDEAIARRIQKNVNSIWKNVNVILFQPPSGIFKVESFLDFTEECNSVWWIGTQSSLNDDMSMHYVKDLLHKSIVDSKKHFTFVAPKENLGIKVPRELEAFEILSEDEKFVQRVESTLNYVTKKQKLDKIERNAPNVQIELENQTINIFGPVGYLQIGGDAQITESQSHSDELQK